MPYIVNVHPSSSKKFECYGGLAGNIMGQLAEKCLQDKTN